MFWFLYKFGDLKLLYDNTYMYTKVMSQMTFKRKRRHITLHKITCFTCVCFRRPYFTYWVTLIQVIVYIIILCVYGFAPVGIGTKTYQEEVIYFIVKLNKP